MPTHLPKTFLSLCSSAWIITCTLACTVFLMAPGSIALADNHDRLSVADYLEFEKIGDPQISPDARQIVYTRQSVDKMNDRWDSALWIMDADGSRNRFLVEGSNARWSPSGDRLLFIAPDANDKPQLFVRWMNMDAATSQVTRVTMTPRSPQWSPDGKQIAFVAIVPAEDNWEIDMPAAPEGASWTEPPRVLDRLHYRQDRVGYTDPGYSQLFVVPASSGSARQLTRGEWNVGAQFDGLFEGATISWSPDSRRIVFDGWNQPDGDLVYRRSHIYAIDIESAAITQLTQSIGHWSKPAFSNDGKSLAYTGYPASDVSYEMPRLYVMDHDGANARLLNETFDRPAATPLWTSDDRGVYLTAQDNGYINVFRIGLDGSLSDITEGKHMMTLTSFAAGLGVGIGSSFYEPGDVVSFKLSGAGDTERLTAVNADLLAGKTLGAHEEIWYEAEDGSPAHGWIITPPDFDPGKKYPLLMEIHGGPFAMYVGRFVFNYQVFAANDFVVLFTNPRGSTGYGETFSQAIDHAYPSVDYLDLMGGVDTAIAKGYIDEKRLYVGGCSGGGVLSSWMIGHTQRFAAAAVRCPVTNWLSMAGTTDIPNFTHSFFDKPFWEDPDKWLQHSSLMHVGKVTTPTAIMTGEQDMRTPMAQSEEYYAALKMRGVPARLLRFNDQYHGTGTLPSNNMRTMLYMMSWYQRYTLDGEVEAESDSGDATKTD